MLGDMADDLATTARDRSKMKRRTDQAGLEARRRDVEQAMLHMPWTLDTQRKLGELHGVNARMIREDAKHIKRFHREGINLNDLEEEKANFLMRLRSAQMDANKDRQYGAAARLFRLEAHVLGLDQPVQLEVTHRASALDPIDQAKAIVDNYEDAKRYLEAVPEQVIEANYESND